MFRSFKNSLRKSITFQFKTFKSFSIKEDPVQKIKDEIMQLSLLNVKKYGWTENCLKISANELGYTNQITSIFKNGPIDLVNHTIDNWNNKLFAEIEEMNKKPDKDQNFDSRVLKTIKMRLSYEIPFVSTWSQAMNLGARPENIIDTSARIYKMSEAIINLNGTDKVSQLANLNLMKIFILSELHLLVDRSNNFSATWKLIELMYSVNSNFTKQFGSAMLVGESFWKLVQYSAISLLPYDFSKIDEMLNLQKETILSER